MAFPATPPPPPSPRPRPRPGRARGGSQKLPFGVPRSSNCISLPASRVGVMERHAQPLRARDKVPVYCARAGALSRPRSRCRDLGRQQKLSGRRGSEKFPRPTRLAIRRSSSHSRRLSRSRRYHAAPPPLLLNRRRHQRRVLLVAVPRFQLRPPPPSENRRPHSLLGLLRPFSPAPFFQLDPATFST